MIFVKIFTKMEKNFKIICSTICIQPIVGKLSSVQEGDGSTITVTTKKYSSKKTFGKRFAVPVDFEFFENHVYL